MLVVQYGEVSVSLHPSGNNKLYYIHFISQKNVKKNCIKHVVIVTLCVCVCVSLRQTQRIMAFAGMLSEENIKAAVQACQGQSCYPFRIPNIANNDTHIYFISMGRKTRIARPGG